MSAQRIYLDHAATSPLRPEAREALERCLARGPGNAASAHAEGREARATLEEARERVASLVGARPDEVVFTSGATEATNLAVRGAARAAGDSPRRVVSTRIEHSATRRACEALAAEGFEVVLLAPDARGLIDPVALERALEPGAALVSLIAGHNELGTIQPLDAIAAAVRSHGARLHLDAVQLAGTVDLSDVPWDLLSLSAHKLGGPQGVGALVARGRVPLAPILVGGPQERGLRPGTVPVALAASFGAAAEAVRRGRAADARRLGSLRDRLAEAIVARVPGLVRLGAWDAPGRALPHIVAFGFDGARGDELVAALDEAGVAASSSAACLGDARSHVLEAIGLPERVGVLRLSLGWSTTEAEIEEAAPRIASALARLAKVAPFERRRALFASRAAAAGVTLTTVHWEAAEAVFAFHAAHGILPGPRHLQRTLGDAAPLDRLFPRGMTSLAEWLGLPLPQGGCRPAPV